MNHGKNIFISATITISISLAGCSISESRLEKVSDPKSQISSRQTPITKELGCFGDMLTTYRQLSSGNGEFFNPEVLVSVMSVADKSGVSTGEREGNSEIPQDMTDMAIGSVAKIGGLLRIVHLPQQKEFEIANIYDVPELKKSFFGSSFKVKSYQNNVNLIYGSLTEYDRTLQNNKTGVDGNADYLSTKTRQGTWQNVNGIPVYNETSDDSTGINLSYNDISNISRMTMDFRIVKIGDGGIVNTESVVTNTIELRQNARDLSFGVNLNGKNVENFATYGLGGAIGYAETMTVVDARHAALRMLIERSTIEALGKAYNLPYWRCLSRKIPEKNNENSAEKGQNSEQKANDEEYVVRPNLPDGEKLSKTSLDALMAGSDYSDSLVDDDKQIGSVDINVINAVKREFELDNYVADGVLTFIKRPEYMKGITAFLEENPNINNIRQEMNMRSSSDLSEKNQVDSMLKAMAKSLYPQCYRPYYVPKATINTSPNNPSNPFNYVFVSTKECFMNMVLSPYGDNKKAYNKLGIYGDKNDVLKKKADNIYDADFYATLWLNVPIKMNARWKH